LVETERIVLFFTRKLFLCKLYVQQGIKEIITDLECFQGGGSAPKLF